MLKVAPFFPLMNRIKCAKYLCDVIFVARAALYYCLDGVDTGWTEHCGPGLPANHNSTAISGLKCILFCIRHFSFCVFFFLIVIEEKKHFDFFVWCEPWCFVSCSFTPKHKSTKKIWWEGGRATCFLYRCMDDLSGFWICLREL